MLFLWRFLWRVLGIESVVKNKDLKNGTFKQKQSQTQKWLTFSAYTPAYFCHFLQIWSCLCKPYTCHNQETGTPKDKTDLKKILKLTSTDDVNQNALKEGELVTEGLLWSEQLTSQTPQRCLLTPMLSLSFCSIWSEKKVSKIWYTSLVVVAFVGPLLSFSIFVGWRMACLLAALLSTEHSLWLQKDFGFEISAPTPDGMWSDGVMKPPSCQHTTASGHAT